MKCMETDRGLSNNGDPCEQEFVRNAWKPIGVLICWSLLADASMLNCMETDRGFELY